MQLLVPPKAQANRDFLRAVLKGDKKLLKLSECKFINVPKYDELGVNNIWPKFKRDEQFMKHFQDEYAKNRLPDRTYFYTVLNTLYPEYVKKLIAHAQEARFSAQGETNAV